MPDIRLILAILIGLASVITGLTWARQSDQDQRDIRARCQLEGNVLLRGKSLGYVCVNPKDILWRADN